MKAVRHLLALVALALAATTANSQFVNVQVAAAASNNGDAAAVNQAQNTNNASADNVS